MKRLIAIMLAVVLVAGGLGGFAYAQSTEHPMTGQKLVGYGFFGTHELEELGELEDATYDLHTMFTFTNPDCVSEITIDGVFILDRDGNVLYEGPLKPWTEERIMMPHEVDAVELHDYLELPRDIDPVTVEIFWTKSDKEGLPLTGWALTAYALFDKEGNLVETSVGENQMVNMEQLLKVEKEVTTLRLQTWQQSGDPLMEPLENFAKAVEQGSGGSVQVELYPAVPLGEIAEAVRQGTVEMGLVPSGRLQDSPSLMDAPQLPFLYNNEDGLMAAVQAGIGDLMTEQIKDMTVLDWTTMSFGHLFSREVMLVEPGDVAGLKIRVPPGIQAEAMTEWGGIPIAIQFAEIYKALEEGKIHGAILSPDSFLMLKLYEVAPYFCVDYAFANLAALSINSDVWNSLDKKTRQIITEAAGVYATEMLATVKQVDADALQQIQQHPGFPVEVYTLSPEERLVWREASQPVWDSWVLDVGDVGQQIIDIALEHNPLP